MLSHGWRANLSQFGPEKRRKKAGCRATTDVRPSGDDTTWSADRARGDRADAPTGLVVRFERGAGTLRIVGGHHYSEPDAVVQHTEHLVVVDAASALQPVENGRPPPARSFDHRLGVLRQHTRHVFDQAAAGDVRHALEAHLRMHGQHLAAVDARWRQQHLAERTAVEVVEITCAAHLDDLAYQRIAVRVRPARGQAKHRVARYDRAAIDDLRLLHDPDRKTGEIVFTRGIHAGHFRRLAADQGAPGKFASTRDAFDHARRDVDIEFAAGVVVEEKQRARALHQ